MRRDNYGSQSVNYFNSVGENDQIELNWRILWRNWKKKYKYD